jgi:hypothetical protein
MAFITHLRSTLAGTGTKVLARTQPIGHRRWLTEGKRPFAICIVPAGHLNFLHERRAAERQGKRSPVKGRHGRAIVRLDMFFARGAMVE